MCEFRLICLLCVSLSFPAVIVFVLCFVRCRIALFCYQYGGKAGPGGSDAQGVQGQRGTKDQVGQGPSQARLQLAWVHADPGARGTNWAKWAKCAQEGLDPSEPTAQLDTLDRLSP